MMTLESIIAAVLILSVAYFLFQSTMIISPISDEVVFVQIKQYGDDALMVLNNESGTKDTLQYALKHINNTYRADDLINSLKKLLPDYIDFHLQVYYLNHTTGKIQVYNITNKIPTSTTVTASTYVVIKNGEFVDDSPFKFNSTDVEGTDSNTPVLFEVRLTLWRV
ncbi:DUF7288 family protein [Geoglobus acetivorans]|uniref:Uncharacterized protein n=1 Tax=Geoglobus acetivorans TaxID=565033 RepID=A0ABZ3H2G7_GEOAI|nr:hypothetical protein [Geoglobus acetivorans]